MITRKPFELNSNISKTFSCSGSLTKERKKQNTLLLGERKEKLCPTASISQITS